MSAAAKQQLARAAGGVFNTVSDITMNWMHPGKKPNSNSSQPAAKKFKKDEGQTNEDILAENTLAYSNLKFSVAGDERKKLSKKAKRNKFTGKDYERLLDKATVRADKLDRIRETNPGKAKSNHRREYSVGEGDEQSYWHEGERQRGPAKKRAQKQDQEKNQEQSRLAGAQEKQEGRTAHKQKKREENIKNKKTRGKNGKKGKK